MNAAKFWTGLHPDYGVAAAGFHASEPRIGALSNAIVGTCRRV